MKEGILLAKVIYFVEEGRDVKKRCPLCSSPTNVGVVMGETEDTLDEHEKQGDFLCPDCFAQILATWRVFAVGAVEACPGS